MMRNGFSSNCSRAHLSVPYVNYSNLPTVKRSRTNERGVTLIELIIVVLISAIALLGAVTPFVGERSFWGTGRRQVEAQRSAQLVMRAIARVARQSSSYLPAANQITFNTPCGPVVFQTAGSANDQFQKIDCTGQTITLIDGVRSAVTQFTATFITLKLIDIQVQITEENQQSEILQTQIFLRN